MTLTIKPGDILKTRGGRDVLIYATDGKGDYPIHGALDGQIETWTIDGKYDVCTECEYEGDLILPKPPAREPMRIWVNVYEGRMTEYLCEKEATAMAMPKALRTAVPFIEVMEDEK